MTHLIGLYLQIILMHLKDLISFGNITDIMYDFRAQIEGTGKRSEVLRVNLV